MLHPELKRKLIKRLCVLKGIEQTENVTNLLMSFPYRVIAKPLVIEDSKIGKFTYEKIAQNYNLSIPQVRYIINNEAHE